jgi:hypothetical protein
MFYDLSGMIFCNSTLMSQFEYLKSPFFNRETFITLWQGEGGPHLADSDKCCAMHISRLRTHNQNMTVAARAIAARKTVGDLS